MTHEMKMAILSLIAAATFGKKREILADLNDFKDIIEEIMASESGNGGDY